MKVNITPHPTAPGWYYIEYRPDGAKGKRIRHAFEGYDEAQRQAEAIRDHYTDKTVTVAKTLHPQIKDVYEDYLAWVKGHQAHKTYFDKQQAFKCHILPHFGDLRVRDITMRTFDTFHTRLVGKRAAIIKYQHYLSAMITWMVKRNYATPLSFKPEQPEYHRPIKQVLHPSSIDAVLDRVPQDKRVMLEMMLYTGLRWNECSQLKWRDIDWRSWSIRVKESEQESESIISIPEKLKSWLHDAPLASEWLFYNPSTSLPWGSFKTLLKRIGAETGIMLTPHMLRHAGATYLYEATGDIYAVQHFLRHADVRTSQIYTRYSTARSKGAQAALAHKLTELRGGQLDKVK